MGEAHDHDEQKRRGAAHVQGCRQAARLDAIRELAAQLPVDALVEAPEELACFGVSAGGGVDLDR